VIFAGETVKVKVLLKLVQVKNEIIRFGSTYMGANTSTGGERHYQQSAGNGSWYSQSTLMADSDRAVFRGEKKRKASRFATLRKKLRGDGEVVVARTSITREPSAPQLLRGRRARSACCWTTYDAMAVMRELQLLASIARPQASTFRKDLSNLFDARHCTDVDLVFQGVVFPVHRAILSVRVRLLSRPPSSLSLTSVLRYQLFLGHLASACSCLVPASLPVLRRLSSVDTSKAGEREDTASPSG
jgi:hypothetical protein